MNNDKPDHSAGGTFNYDKNGKLVSHDPPSRPRDGDAIQPATAPKKSASKPRARKVVSQKASAPTKLGPVVDATPASTVAE